MRLCDIKIGQRFKHCGKEYLRIDVNLFKHSHTVRFPGMIAALDLQTYKVVCIHANNEVENSQDIETV